MLANSADETQRVNVQVFDIIHSYTVALAAMKNVPLRPEVDRRCVEGIIADLSPPEVQRLVEARCIEISANIHAQLNLYFDWEASRHTVYAFVRAAGLAPSQDALDELVDALYNAVTGDYPFDRPTYRWPDALTFDCMLKMRVATLPPTCGPDDLLKVILNPAIAEPVTATMPSRSCQA